MVEQKKKKNLKIDATAFRIAAAVVVFCIILCVGDTVIQCNADSQREESLNNITCFRQFTVKDFEGNTVDESILQGYKLTVINCWETTCSPCVAEMPDLYALSEEYQDQGVQVIGLCGDLLDGEAEVDQAIFKDALEIVDSTGAAYTHLIPSSELAKGFLNYVIAFPTTIFVDEKGNEIYYTMGSRSKEEWKAVIDQKLQELD